jgi:hypothetical protein
MKAIKIAIVVIVAVIIMSNVVSKFLPREISIQEANPYPSSTIVDVLVFTSTDDEIVGALVEYENGGVLSMYYTEEPVLENNNYGWYVPEDSEQ